MPRTKQPNPDTMVRAFMDAACTVTRDDPLRGTSIHDVAEHLGWDDWAVLDAVVALAAHRG